MKLTIIFEREASVPATRTSIEQAAYVSGILAAVAFALVVLVG